MSGRIATVATRLRKRDLNVLSYIAQNYFAPVDILRDLFWEGKKNQAEYRRLIQLSKMGLIEPLSSNRNIQLCYRLTERGLRFMKAKGLALVLDGGAQRNYGTSFEHDRNLQLIRRILESASCISGYLSETEVRKILAERHGIQRERDQRYKVPDALFNLRLSDATLRVALELELSVKSMKRTRRLMELQATSQDFESTFYVTGSDKLMERLAQVLGEVRKNNHRVRHQGKDHGFYFISLADLLKGQTKAVFQGEGTSFTLSQLSKRLDEMSK
jgi:hypothetical protein